MQKQNRFIKMSFLLLLFLAMTTTVQGQDLQNIQEQKPQLAHEKQKNFGYIRFHWHAQYHGFPMEVAIGLGYRKNNLFCFIRLLVLDWLTNYFTGFSLSL